LYRISRDNNITGVAVEHKRRMRSILLDHPGQLVRITGEES
jgi:hypothetical protein